MEQEKAAVVCTVLLPYFLEQIKKNKAKQKSILVCPECGSHEHIVFFDDFRCKRCLAVIPKEDNNG